MFNLNFDRSADCINLIQWTYMWLSFSDIRNIIQVLNYMPGQNPTQMEMFEFNLHWILIVNSVSQFSGLDLLSAICPKRNHDGPDSELSICGIFALHSGTQTTQDRACFHAWNWTEFHTRFVWLVRLNEWRCLIAK